MQPYIDAYFKRIADIIKKDKISLRIKFKLQDVQELRSNNWVPRPRQEKILKTIDQVSAWGHTPTYLCGVHYLERQ